MLAFRVLSRLGLRPALRTTSKSTFTPHNTASIRLLSTSRSSQWISSNYSQPSLRTITWPTHPTISAIRWQSNSSNGTGKPPNTPQTGPIGPSSKSNTKPVPPSDPNPQSSQTIDVDSSSPETPGKIKLPDLRQGIPSTFEAEYLKNESGKRSTEITHEPDITDQEAGADGARSGGGGGRGDIPKGAYETSIDRRRAAVARYFYIAWALMMIGGSVYYGRNWDTEEEERAHPDAPSGWGPSLMYNRIKTRVNEYLGYYTEPTFPKLLPTVKDQNIPPYTLVISLEDMLVHSEWSREHGWRTAKRPGADFFLLYLSQYYELCLFTSVQFAMADPIVKKLDPYHIIMWPLFREATRYENGDYVKVRQKQNYSRMQANNA
jgi:mitochondrial import inner membrane translocase subunit TIM50